MDRLAREEMIVVALGSGDKPYEEMFLRLNGSFRKDCGPRSLTTTRWHTKSKLEATCSSCLPVRALRSEPDLQFEIRHRAIVRATGGLDDTS